MKRSNCTKCGTLGLHDTPDDIPYICKKCSGVQVVGDSPILGASNSSQKPGTISNARITARNGGVRHQFLDDIGGCSANYR